MKRFFTLFALGALLFSSCTKGPKLSSSSSAIDSVSYALGQMYGTQLQRNLIEPSKLDNFNKDLFLSAMRSALKNDSSAMLNEQMASQMLNDFFMKRQAAQAAEKEAELNAKKEKNMKEGQDFLKKNATESGVVVTESGLQYKVLSEGNGISPKDVDTVVVNYSGTLIDGTKFDSSYDRNEPATFPLNQVIAGWTEGIQLMKKGAKYTFYIPANLAYGESARSEVLGPNSTLIFEVELVDVRPFKEVKKK